MVQLQVSNGGRRHAAEALSSRLPTELQQAISGAIEGDDHGVLVRLLYVARRSNRRRTEMRMTVPLLSQDWSVSARRRAGQGPISQAPARPGGQPAIPRHWLRGRIRRAWRQ